MRYNYYMWSEKKSVNIVVNILLFLLGINIFHFGQFTLPVICLILFIDNKFKFNVKDIKTFIILCLFSLTFCAFTYNMGFYCVMGFCLPMAYYIGSNLKDRTENGIVKIVYILTFGMAMHVFLNFAYEYALIGSQIFKNINHLDIWTKEKISTTATAINYTFLIGVIYYAIFYEKAKKYKYINLALFFVLFIYNFALGRRTPILMLAIALCVSLFLDYVVYKKRTINKKNIIKILIVLCILAICGITLYLLNIFDIQNNIGWLNLILKFRNFGLNPERIELWLDGIKIAPKYLWGGQLISEELGVQIHDLWMDTYDYSGIVPFILLTIYTILVIIDLYKIMKNTIHNKTLFITFLLCVLIQMLLEPIMSGSSIFLICTIIVITSIQTLKY